MKIFYDLRDYCQNKEILYPSAHLSNTQIPKIVDFSKLGDPKLYNQYLKIKTQPIA